MKTNKVKKQQMSKKKKRIIIVISIITFMILYFTVYKPIKYHIDKYIISSVKTISDKKDINSKIPLSLKVWFISSENININNRTKDSIMFKSICYDDSKALEIIANKGGNFIRANFIQAYKCEAYNSISFFSIKFPIYNDWGQFLDVYIPRTLLRRALLNPDDKSYKNGFKMIIKEYPDFKKVNFLKKIIEETPDSQTTAELKKELLSYLD